MSLLFASALALSSSAFAADQIWNDAGPSDNWNTTEANWDASATWTQGNSATFGGAGETVTLTEPIDAAGVTFGSAGYTITSNTLTLTGTPAIATGANAATINSILAGSAGVTVNGAGTLTLGGANAISGQITIAGGTVKAGNAAALGAGGAGNETIVQSGATLGINGLALAPTELIRIAGAGVGDAGAVINNGANQQNAINNLTLTADASVGGTGRFDIRTGTSPFLDLAGHTLTKTGANQFSIVGANVTDGNIVIANGTLSIEAGSTVTGAGTITIAAGKTLGLYGIANITRPIVSNGGNINNLGLEAKVDSDISLASGTTTLIGTKTTYNGALSGRGGLTVGNGVANVAIGSTGSIATTGVLSLGAGATGNAFSVAAGATVSAASIANPWQTAYTIDGTLTTPGAWTISTNAASNIAGAATGIMKAASLTTGNSATTVNYSALGAMTLTGNITLGGSAGSGMTLNQSAGTINAAGLALNNVSKNTFSLTGGRMNIGAGGIAGTGGNRAINLGAGTLGAQADWSSSLNMTLTDTATGVTFDTSDPATAAAHTVTLSGVLSGAGGKLNKTGAGTLVLSGANTYTGETHVSGGYLALAGGSEASPITVDSGATLGLTAGSPATSTSTVTFSGANAKVTVSGTPAAGTLLTATSITGTPVLDPALSGFSLAIQNGGTELVLNPTGGGSDYNAWAATNGVSGQSANLDHDNDGVSNGIEYFLGGNTVTTGFTPLPGVTTTGGVRSVTWTKGATYSGTYGTDFVVETSTTLTGPWTQETVGGNVTISGNDVTYTFPAGPAKNFARLKVTGP